MDFKKYLENRSFKEISDNLYELANIADSQYQDDLYFAARYFNIAHKEETIRNFAVHAIDCGCEGCALDADIGAEEVVYTNAEQWAFYYNGKPLQEIEESLELTQPSVEFCKQIINTGRLYEDRGIKLKAYIEKYETYE